MQQWDASMAAVKSMLKSFDRRRLRLLEGLQSISGIQCARAQGAFYLFPKINDFGMSSMEFSAQLLEEEKVAVVPGEALKRSCTGLHALELCHFGCCN